MCPQNSFSDMSLPIFCRSIKLTFSFIQSFLPNCNMDELPTPQPTVSPKPTPSVTSSPTPGMPTTPQTPVPTGSPIPKDDIRNFFFCGIDWMDASTRCYKQCLSGFHSDWCVFVRNVSNKFIVVDMTPNLICCICCHGFIHGSPEDEKCFAQAEW